MAGIVYEPPVAPAAPPVAPVTPGSGFSPQTFREKKDQYDDLLGAVLSQRTTGWLDGIAKMATSGFLGYQKRKNQDKADAERGKAGESLTKLIEALSGRGKTAVSSTAPKLVDAIAAARGAPAGGTIETRPLAPMGAAPPVGGGMQPPVGGGQPMGYGPGSSAMPPAPGQMVMPTLPSATGFAAAQGGNGMPPVLPGPMNQPASPLSSPQLANQFFGGAASGLMNPQPAQPPMAGGQPMGYDTLDSAVPGLNRGQPLSMGGGLDHMAGGAGQDQIYGKLPPDMIRMESGGNQFDKNGQPLTSSAGAIGIAQVMPATGPEAAALAGLPWDEQRYRNDPQYNEALGAAYYQAQKQRYGGDEELARAGYNAGPGRTDQYVNGGRPLPAETVKYADMNGDGRIGGGGAPMQPPVAGGGGQNTMAGGAGGDTIAQQGQQFGPEVLQAALSILSNQWADEGQKQVAGMILTQVLKQDQPVQWEKLNDTTLYNPLTQETKAVGPATNGLAPGNFDDQAKLRGEYLKQSTDFMSVRDAFGRLQASSQDTTGASDVAMVYSFMKMLDPGSVVREGEFATAENTAGIPDQVRALYNRALSGERLAPQVRQDFLQQGARQFANAKSRQDATVKQYSTLAQRYGFDPSVIGIDLSAGVGIPEGQPGGAAGAGGAAPPAGALRAVNPQTNEAVIWNGSAWVPEGAQ